MAISDKVIELETKKKGRTAIFIVIIALLAAASAAFAVLWVVKAPAVDPPAVERIIMSGGDLCQSGTTQDGQNMYKVSPSCKYSVVFDMEIKSGFEASEVNALINVSTEPVAGAISNSKVNSVKVMPAEEGVSDRDIYRCELEFTVNKDIKNDFDIIVSSEYTKDVGLIIPCKLDTSSYTEYFDVATRNGVRVLYERDNANNTVPLVKVAEKSSDTVTYLKSDEEYQLVYYVQGNSGSKRTPYYRIDLEQFGSLGENGQYAKVYGGTVEEKFDLVKVETGVGTDWEKVDYTEMTYMHYSNDDISFGDLKYCHEYVEFRAERANQSGTSNFIKLTANTNRDGAPELIIVLELEFVSSDTLDKITEIVVTDPYTKRAFAKDEAAVINLYRGKLVDASDLAFTLSDCISVKRGDKTENASWDTDGLTYSVSSPDGLFVKDSTAHGAVLKLTSIDKTGSCKVQVRDTDPRGFNAYKDITVNLLAHIENATVGGKDSYTIDTTSDRESTFGVDFALAQNVKFADVKNSLNAEFTVEYPEGYAAPAANATAAQKEKTFVIEGLKGNTFTPVLAEGKTPNAFTGAIKIRVGKEIPSKQYVFKFTLASQGFEDHKNGEYIPIPGKVITVVVNVTHIASGVNVSSAFFTDLASGKLGEEFANDKYTEYAPNEYTTDKPYNALLTIGVGTGTSGHTAFTLRDIVEFYNFDDKGNPEIVTDKGDINVNMNSLAVNDTPALTTGGEVADRSFTVPAEYKADTHDVTIKLGDDTFTIRVEYKMPVTGVKLKNPELKREGYYDRPTSAGYLSSSGTADELIISSGSLTVNAANQVKHPELLNFDIAVLRADTAKILLPKRIIKGDWYYFVPNTDFTALDNATGTAEDIAKIEKQYTDKAVFRIGYASILSGNNITILRDLYELTYHANELGSALAADDGYVMPQIDFQRVYCYYSYGTRAEGTDEITDINPHGNVILTNERNVVSWINPTFVAVAEWNFIRNLDSVRIYEDETYTKQIDYNKAREVWSGAQFNVYYSGVIIFGDGTEVIIEKDKALLNKFLCGSVEILPTTGGYISHSGDNVFVATCASGTSATGSSVTFSYALKGLSAKIYINVSNTTVKVQSISFYLTDPVDGNGNEIANAIELNADNIPLIIGKGQTIKIYYKVVYEPRKAGDSAFEEFMFEHGTDFTANITSHAELPPSFIVDPATKQEQHRRSGTITFNLSSNAAAGDYKFRLVNAAKNIIAEQTVRVTAPIEEKDFKATTTDGSGTVREIWSLASNATNQTIETLNYKFDAAQGANNVYDFTIDFGNADKRNLKYEFENGSIDGVTATINGDGAGCVGYRITLTNKRIINALLTFKVIEEYKEYNAATHTFDTKTNEYYFHSYINVDVPVTELQLTVKQGTETKTYANGDTATFTADGSSGDIMYDLGVIINNNDTDRQPQAAAAQYSIANVGAESVFRLDGSKLYFNSNVLNPASATLSVTVGDMTISITLKSQTNKRLIKFDNKWQNAVEITDNNAITVLANIYDAGAPQNVITGEQSKIKYTVNMIGGSLTVTQSATSGTFTLNGAYGIFTVTATYEYGGEIISATSGVITVNVPLGNIVVKHGETVADYGETNPLTIVNGQTAAFTAYVPYTVASLTHVTSGITATSSDGSVAVATVDNSGNVTVRALKAGNAVITVSYGDGNSKTIHVSVTDGPTLNITANKTVINAFDSNAELNVSIGQVSGYTLNVSEVKVANDHNQLFTVTNNGSSYTVTLNKSKTAEIATAIANHTQFAVTAKATVNELNNAEITSNTLYFTLAASGYEPTVKLVNTANSNSEVTDNLISKQNLKNYKFEVSAPNGFTPSVTYSSAALEIDNNTEIGKVTGLNSGYNSISGTVTATVTVLGLTYTANYGFTFTEEHSSITSALYYSASKVTNVSELIDEDGNVDTTKLTEARGDINIDSTKVITVVVDYTSAPSAMLGATKANFNIAASSNVTKQSNDDIVIKKGKYYYVAQFSADKIGEASFTAYTSAIGGVAYSAQTVRVTISATEPVFTLSVAALSLAPGESKTVTVTKNGFAGNVTYSWQLNDSKNIVSGNVAQDATDNNKYTLTAAVNKTEGTSATLTLTATVTNNAYGNKTYTVTLPVTVDSYAAPEISVKQNTLWLKKGESKNLAELLGVTRDSRDEHFNVEYTFTKGGVTVENGTYIASATENIVIDGTYEITGGFFKGRTGNLNSSIKIVVAPEITWVLGNESISQTGEANLSVQLAYGTLGNVTYVMNNPAAGAIVNGKFIPSRNFMGSVTITATASVTYADMTGETRAITKTVTVTEDKEPELADGALTLTVNSGSGTAANAAITGKLNIAEQSGITVVRYECESEYLTVDGVGNCVITPATQNEQVTVKVHYVITEGKYAGTVTSKDFTVTVEGLGEIGEPELNETAKTITFAPSGYTVDYNVTKGSEYITVSGTQGSYGYEFNENANGKEVQITFTVAVASGDYAGYVKTVTLDIPTPPVVVPTTYTLTLAVDYTAKTVTPTLKASDDTSVDSATYAYSADGESVIKINENNGAFEIKGAGTAKVTVTATLNGSVVATATCDIVVFGVEKPVPTVYTLTLKSDETTENKLVYELTANPESDIPDGVTYEFTVKDTDNVIALDTSEQATGEQTYTKTGNAGTAQITVVAKLDGKVIATSNTVEITVTLEQEPSIPTE